MGAGTKPQTGIVDIGTKQVPAPYYVQGLGIMFAVHLESVEGGQPHRFIHPVVKVPWGGGFVEGKATVESTCVLAAVTSLESVLSRDYKLLLGDLTAMLKHLLKYTELRYSVQLKLDTSVDLDDVAQRIKALAIGMAL